ncbi:CHASE domain-containing protein [Alteraurantiacibacter aquimixticola]|uniref:CHASE domain-containing protein n=1 Tax=Alteraurantiacibacter aquimixticola TaxID=2489173 RepID=UPI001FECAF0C|nr:CHASE domain-containing protein [Alteraurantiacibacter aquimixticola]
MLELDLSERATRRSRTKRWLVRYPRALPVGIFLLVAAITVLAIFAIERSEAQRSNAQLASRTTAIASALERRSNASSAYLRAGAALLATLDDIAPDTFRRFVSELRLDADYRGAEGIGWAMVVRPGEFDAFDQLLDDGAPVPAQFYPAFTGEQPYAVPVTFLQPDTQRNRRALGYDMFSEPVRRTAMMEAERTARPTASGKVVLQQEGGAEQPGFLIYMPVFEGAPGGRRLRGYIYSPFNAQDFLSSALELEDAGSYGVTLYHAAAAPDNVLATTTTEEVPLDQRSHELVTIANSPFVLEVSRADTGVLSGLSMATLIFGLLVASLLMLVVRMLTQQALEDEASLVWFEEQASIRNSLTRELNHRVKNTLANVLSIIALTRRRAEDVGAFADGLDGRIRALSATHDLLTNSDWGTTPVEAVVRAELLPYTQDAEHAVELSGPEVELAPNDALSLGLAMHELATNAAKYGALSQPGGKVSVNWQLEGDALVRVEWQESGGPAVPAQRGRGFGTDLIERIVAHELRNPVQLEFNPDGVRCVLLIPVREPTEFAIRASEAAAKKRLRTADLKG